MRFTYLGVVVLGLNAATSVAVTTWRGTDGTGGPGDWSTAANWGIGGVPNGSGIDVAIDGGKSAASVVMLNQEAKVRALTIEAGDTLAVNPTYELDAYGNLFIDGTLTVVAGASAGGGFAFLGNAAKTLSGTGTLAFTGTATAAPIFYNDSAASKITIGSGLTVDVTTGVTINGYFENQTALAISTPARSLLLIGRDALHRFTNAASVSATDGAVLQLNTVANAGTISVTNGSLLRIGNFVNSGTIGVVNSDIEIGSAATADLRAISRSGTGTLSLTAALDNTGATLALTSATGSYELRGGTVRNGTLTTSGGASLFLPSGYNGTLDGVTIAAASDVKQSGLSNLYVPNDLTLNGTITVGATAAGSPSLVFSGTSAKTVSGTGTISLDATSGTPLVSNPSKVGKVTLANGVKVNGAGTLTGWFDNNAAVTADAGGGRPLVLQGVDATHPFTQNGKMVVTNNGTLRIGSFVVTNTTTDIRRGRAQFLYNGSANSPATALRALLATGYATNFTTGKIVSSTAVAGVRGLGYRDDGSAAVTVAYTYYGDADLDGGVSINDFNALSANFGAASGRVWASGDFDYDGGVSINDFNLLSVNFGNSVPGTIDWTPLLAFAAGHDDLAEFETLTGVPEPAGVLLLATVAATATRRRRPV